MTEVGFHVRLSIELRKAIEQLAKDHRRTLNSEVIVALEQYVKQQNRPDEEFSRNLKYGLHIKKNDHS